MRHRHQQVVDQPPILAAPGHGVAPAAGSPLGCSVTRIRPPSGSGRSRPRSRFRLTGRFRKPAAASAPKAITIARLRQPGVANVRGCKPSHRSRPAAARGRQVRSRASARSSNRPAGSGSRAPLVPDHQEHHGRIRRARRHRLDRHAGSGHPVPSRRLRLCCSGMVAHLHRSSAVDICSCFVLGKVVHRTATKRAPRRVRRGALRL